MADWQAIKTEYITTDTSYRKLAQKHGVNATNIAKRASSEGWVEQRKQNASKTLAKTLNAVGRKQAEQTAKLFGVSDLLLDKVKRLLEENEELLADTSAMKDVSVVLKNLKDLLMIKSEIDLREQEARIEKLRADAQQRNNDDDDDETGVILMPPVMEVPSDD
jgi:transposase-like protein